ncbi:hypothetical protein [Radiobacillus deserti]|uniref:Lipoprotein n=1 Tax=Radiobacillus deserti TaxID=2594883 RepID=A0A516KIT9_9BACI|nr:hypothetical protein [Radiobacillus deserti]QDP41302.1 hypothetical protein FN924_14590 [Radiobacillus deserti]
MKKGLIALIALSIIVVGCGQTATSNPSNAKKNVEANSKEENTGNISAKEMIALTGSISDRKKEIVQGIQQKGWYEKGIDFVPGVEEFQSLVQPILQDTFTQAFIEKHIVQYRETFFCECDAPGALQGSMLPSFHKPVTYEDVHQATFTAYYPANEINSGAKFHIEVTKQEGKWKINDWQFISSSYEEPFDLKAKEVKAYYEKEGNPVTLEHTLRKQDDRLNMEYAVYLFKQNNDYIAVDARNWYTVEGKERIQQFLGVQEEVFVK